jgi:hypothetical protein
MLSDRVERDCSRGERRRCGARRMGETTKTNSAELRVGSPDRRLPPYVSRIPGMPEFIEYDRYK